MDTNRPETFRRFAPRNGDRRDAGQATTEYIALTALLLLVIAIVLVAARPIGTDVGDQLACAVRQVDTSNAFAECVDEPDNDVGVDEPGDEGGDDEGGDDQVDLPGGEGSGAGLVCLPEWDLCQPDAPRSPDPDDCTTDDTCEEVWEGSLAPHEPEGDIDEVGFLQCNFNVLGWYPSDYVRFSWEVRSLTGSGGAAPNVCVDGSGTVNIDQEGVERFNAGENSGWFVYKGADGYEYKHSFEEGEILYFDPSSTIYEVHID